MRGGTLPHLPQRDSAVPSSEFGAYQIHRCGGGRDRDGSAANNLTDKTCPRAPRSMAIEKTRSREIRRAVDPSLNALAGGRSILRRAAANDTEEIPCSSAGIGPVHTNFRRGRLAVGAL